MLQTTDLPRIWLPPPRAELRPSAKMIEGAAAGDRGRAGEQRLAGGETQARDRRAALKVSPQPNPDPPTGPPPAFDVTPLEHLQDQTRVAAQTELTEKVDRGKKADRRAFSEQAETEEPLGKRDMTASKHVDMKV